jgi:hypothetical protein
MPRVTIIDSAEQRASWTAFEAMANSTLGVLRSFGSAQPIATAMLIKLLVADNGGRDAHTH